MTKKDQIIVAGCVLLAIVLAALLVIEVKNPAGGAAFLAGLRG